MTILTFVETLIRIFMLSESFAFFFLPFLWLLNGLNSMIFAASGATWPFGGRVAGLSEAESPCSFERSYMAY